MTKLIAIVCALVGVGFVCGKRALAEAGGGSKAADIPRIMLLTVTPDVVVSVDGKKMGSGSTALHVPLARANGRMVLGSGAVLAAKGFEVDQRKRRIEVVDKDGGRRVILCKLIDADGGVAR